MAKEIFCIDPGQTAGFATIDSKGKIYGFSRKVGQNGAHPKQLKAIEAAIVDLIAIHGKINATEIWGILNTNPHRQVSQQNTIRDFQVSVYVYAGEEPIMLHDTRVKKLVFPDWSPQDKKVGAHKLLKRDYDLSGLQDTGPDVLDAVIGCLYLRDTLQK